MRILHIAAYLAAGALFANSLPHLVQGVSGHCFPTPFAHPTGIGPSSPTTNVLWACINLGLSYTLTTRIGRFNVAAWDCAASWFFGFVAAACLAASLFAPFWP